MASAPIYCAAKAGIHSYTQSLRIQLHNTNVQVFEIAPPATSTPLLENLGSDTLNSQSPVVMKLDKMVSVAMKGLEKDIDEIRPGMSNVMKWMSRVAPNFILKQVNKSVAQELAKAQPTGGKQEVVHG